MSLEKNIAIYEVQTIQGVIDAITADIDITRIKKEESEEKIQKIKSVISENSSILDNKCSENVEILREKLIWRVN